jgi:NCS1 family nucleobase:cation symporter-1
LTLLCAGFFISAITFYILNVLFPVPDMDQFDDLDIYGTFSPSEARRAGVVPLDEHSTIVGKVDARYDRMTAEDTINQRHNNVV